MTKALKLLCIVGALSSLTMLAKGCGPSPLSQTRDVATDLAGNGTWLFYTQGQDVVRALCPANARLFDRGTCTSFKRSVPAFGFYHELSKLFGAGLPALDQRTQDLYVRVARIDNKLLELVNANPNPARPDLKEAIAAKEVQLADVTSRVAELKDQIARIEDQLARREDADLRTSLRTLQETLQSERVVQATKQAELSALRDEYVRTNASILDQRTFQDLQDQRREAVGELQRAKAELDGELNEQIEYGRAMKMLADQGYTWEVRQGGSSMAGVRPMVEVFEQTFAKIQTAEVYAGDFLKDRTTFEISVTRNGKLKHFSCNFEYRGDAYRYCKSLHLVGPGFDKQLAGTSFRVAFDEDGTSHNALETLETAPLAGRWQVTPVCERQVTLDFWMYGCTLQYEPADRP